MECEHHTRQGLSFFLRKKKWRFIDFSFSIKYNEKEKERIKNEERNKKAREVFQNDDPI